MKTLRAAFFAVFAIVCCAFALPAFAQTATVHGHITNPAGVPYSDVTVKLTTDKTAKPSEAKITASGQSDANGDYNVTDIPPGDYSAFVTQGDKFIDRLEIKLSAGENATLDFDMTRAEFQKGLSAEDKKQIEEYKKRNAQVTAENSVIKNLNAALLAVRADLKTATPNYDKDIADMKAATTAKPDAPVLWITLGDALVASADNMAKADKAQGKPASSDEATVAQYQAGVDAYKKGIDLDAASKKPNPNDTAIAYSQMGSALAKAGKIKEAQDAYENAAKTGPQQAALAYYNEAAVLYNACQTDPSLNQPAVDAANKAIAADPTKPAPYYIKGQILLQKATLDPKTNKLVTPPGCIEAYQKYIELAPDGPFAPSVKDILASLGQKVDTHYSAKKH